jgi:protein SCO1/2
MRTRRELRIEWRAARVLLLSAAVAGTAAAAARAQANPQDGVDVRERLGSRVDPQLAFLDHEGRPLRLGELLGPRRPVLLTLNYFRCKTLCDLQLERIADSLRVLSDVRADAFRVVTVSIDPRDAPADAARKRASYLRRLGRADLDWRFLTGSESQVDALAGSVGFGYRYDSRTDQYAHAPVLFVLSPDGRVVRYLYGLDREPRELRLALVEASQGRLGRTLDRVLLRCFRFEPAAGRYGMYVLGAVRLGGVLTVLGLALGSVLLRRTEERRQGDR